MANFLKFHGNVDCLHLANKLATAPAPGEPADAIRKVHLPFCTASICHVGHLPMC